MQERFIHNSTENNIAGQSCIEEDFYFASPDKLAYIMREFKAETNHERANDVANPLVVSKLDLKSVMNYNFPLIPRTEIGESINIDK
jgi:hypothetical protein